MWYIQGGMAAVCTIRLGTRNSEFVLVVWSMVDGLRETCGLLWISIPTQTGFSRYTSDNWIEKPPTADEQNWFQGLIAHKPMPSSSQIKGLGPKVEPKKKRFEADFHEFGFHGAKKHDCFHGTLAKEDRITPRSKKVCGESFIIKIEKYGNVNHSPENLVWKIPGFCYLECINLSLDRGHFWPANPTVYTFANFGRKFRKSINFCLIETKPGEHFTVKTFPGGDAELAWKRIELLATTDKSFFRVGGNDDDSSSIKLLDGTNYH